MRFRSKIFAVLALASLMLLMVYVWSSQPAANQVQIIAVASTNDGPGSQSYFFNVTNGLGSDVMGHLAVEVMHDGFWFNALPQPDFPNSNLIQVEPGKSAIFGVNPPTGRAQTGLREQPNPPGSRWRLAYYGIAPQPRSGLLKLFLSILPRKSYQRNVKAFSPEIAFSAEPRPTKTPR